jgi:hypothetical protein
MTTGINASVATHLREPMRRGAYAWQSWWASELDFLRHNRLLAAAFVAACRLGSFPT